MGRSLMNRKGFTLGEIILVFAFLVALAAVMLPVIRHNLRRTDQVLCTNNLQQIGRAMYIYAREHDGDFPPAVNTLYEEQYLSDTTLVDCPASAEVGTPLDPDYIYTAGLSVRSDSDKALLRDKSKNHTSGGRNILFVNGDIVWKHQ